MKRALILERGVERELEAAIDWYESQRPGLGIDVAREVREVFKRLATRRVLGGARVNGVSSDLPVRKILLKRFPFAVVFIVNATTVHIVAVAHRRRRPNYWARRIRRL